MQEMVVAAVVALGGPRREVGPQTLENRGAVPWNDHTLLHWMQALGQVCTRLASSFVFIYK